jgi:hypothetical protein
MKNLIIIAMVLILGSCKSTQIQQQETKHDSIFVQKIITKYDKVIDTIMIDNPCDSNGILLPFRERIKAQQGNVSIEAKNGKLRAIVHYYPLVSSDNYRVEYKYITRTAYKTQIKKQFDWTPWVILVGIALVYILINLRPKFF